MRNKNSDERILLNNFNTAGVPEILALGRFNKYAAGPPRGMHVHKQSIEIFYLVRGKDVIVTPRQIFRVSGGEVFITPPDFPHGSGNYPIEKSLFYWMVLGLPAPHRSYAGIDPQDAAVIFACLSDQARVQKAHPDLRKNLDAISSACQNPHQPLRRTIIQNNLISILLGMTGKQVKSAVPALPDDVIPRVLVFINKEIDNNPGIKTIASHTGLTVPVLIRKFYRTVGMSLHQYILREKIRIAARALPAEPITRLAYQLGFSSSQHFATAFKRITGYTPTRYRALPAEKKFFNYF
ncbi:MAG: hypothetical protein A2096_04915 [Spirochaetes bacterium GWF1_41_5]|nr:MAG: hypothetical protein A2096_04915 [Spirochaetes bacterium GWF1_41_5]HBE04344.1 hypothetical protein [Spirochaetia bacterium]